MRKSKLQRCTCCNHKNKLLPEGLIIERNPKLLQAELHQSMAYALAQTIIFAINSQTTWFAINSQTDWKYLMEAFLSSFRPTFRGTSTRTKLLVNFANSCRQLPNVTHEFCDFLQTESKRKTISFIPFKPAQGSTVYGDQGSDGIWRRPMYAACALAPGVKLRRLFQFLLGIVIYRAGYVVSLHTWAVETDTDVYLPPPLTMQSFNWNWKL